MSAMKTDANSRPVLRSILLWCLAVIFTFACFSYQDKTGPTYPLEGNFATAKGDVHFKFLRSENIGTSLKIMLVAPVPSGISGSVKYRRFKSHDEWSTIEMQPGNFEFSRRGRKESVTGMGAELPSLDVRAGKYEYFVNVSVDGGEPASITGETPVYARYKGAVPAYVLVPHILVVFLSMAFALRTILEAIVDGRFKWLLWATIISLIIGAFVLGPLVQLYAFGVLWSGVPFGWDWTDNKVLVELAFWIFALWANRGENRNRWSVFLAGIATLIVYFIPHSIFGSEYDFRTGTGRGTIG